MGKKIDTIEDVSVESVARGEYRAERYEENYVSNRSRELTMRNFISTRKSLIISICVMIMLISGFFGIVGIVSATDYYVATNGIDSNPGTLAEPWRTIGKVNELQPGDNLRLLPGTYYGTNTITNSGIPEEPITIISHSSDPNHYAIIDVATEPSDPAKQGFYINGASWITLENLKFRHSGKRLIVLENSSYISIRDCETRGLGPWSFVVATTGTHHVLIENCDLEGDERTWTEWTFNEMHHYPGVHYTDVIQTIYSGSSSGGGVVIRNNCLKYAFNFLEAQATNLNNNINAEIYGNYIDHVMDNAIEPEQNVFNMHVYHNVFNQIHAGLLSIDTVEGGPIYFYGNVGYHNLSDPPYDTLSAEGRIFKMVSGSGRYLDEPLHCYHNSWDYKCLTQESNRMNHHVHHFNNIGNYTNGYSLIGWQFDELDNIFDYDCSNKPWPSSILDNNQEQHGIVADPKFRDSAAGDFRLQSDSLCIDAGKVIPGFTQSYEGSAPDMGAYEGDHLVEGPPFQFLEPPGGSLYVEKPRMVRHRVNGNQLTIFFSIDINPSTVNKNSITLQSGGQNVAIQSVAFHDSPRAMVITTGQELDENNLAIQFDPLPVGTNGETATYWASVLSTTLGEPSATGIISGTVTDKDTGLGIEGATVTANGYSDPDGTDDNGDYIILNVPGGTSYTVTASKTGYYNQIQENVEVLDGQTTTINFQLTKKPSLVAEWHFDEGSGIIAEDTSGNNNDGTLTNMDPATDWVDGKLGKALDFDGVDDYVDLPIMNDTSAYTMEMWIYPDALGGFLFANDAGTSWKSSASTATWHTRIDGSSTRDGMALPSLTTGEWTHLAFTYDGVNDVKKIYKNGVTVTTKTPTSHGAGSLDLDSATANMIGNSNDGSNFNGTIDEVKIYNRVLSADEIKADYEAGLEDVTPPETTITSAPDGTITYNNVSFNWTGSDDVTPTSQLVYSYKLENYDGDWSSWTSNTSKSYNDLPNDNYTFKVKAKDQAGKEDPTPAEGSFNVLVDLSPNGSIFGTITYTCNETGIAGATVNLTRVTDGTLIASTTTESSGNYTFTDVSSGDYNLNASKIRFWSNSTSVTVNAGASTTANLTLWLKGDLNNDGTSAGIEDVAMMDSAWKDEIPKDFRYDLNNDGTPADIGDRAMMESAWKREIVLM